MSHFAKPSDVILNIQAEEIPLNEIKSTEVQEIIDRMFDIAKGERTDPEARSMVGLAAPQIGISKRIILVDIGVDSERRDLGKLTAFINPEIVWYSEELVEGREGCFSVDERVAGIVQRSKSIKIKAYDRDGNIVLQEFSDFTARIFQHEIDHLQGIRFPDRIGEQGKLQWVKDAEYPEYRKNWQNWPHKCPWDVWQAMKLGETYESPVN